MTDLETRIRRGLTEYVEATPVSDAAPFVPVAARRRYIRLVAPVMVAAATLTILLAAVALVRPGSGGPAWRVGGRRIYPHRVRRLLGVDRNSRGLAAGAGGRGLPLHQ